MHNLKNQHVPTILTMVLLIVVITVTTGMIIQLPRSSADIIYVYNEVIVEPGDTLWNIARQQSPSRDPREVVWEIRTANQLEQAVVYPGQRLQVPVQQGKQTSQSI